MSEIGDEPKEDTAKGKEKKKRRRKKDKAEEERKDDLDDLFERNDIAVSEVVTSEHETVDSVPSECSTQFEDQLIHSFDEDQSWIEWEEFVEVISPVAASVPVEMHSPKANGSSIPMMPCTSFLKDEHRERLGESLMGNIIGNALVARPVGRKEM